MASATQPAPRPVPFCWYGLRPPPRTRHASWRRRCQPHVRLLGDRLAVRRTRPPWPPSGPHPPYPARRPEIATGTAPMWGRSPRGERGARARIAGIVTPVAGRRVQAEEERPVASMAPGRDEKSSGHAQARLRADRELECLGKHKREATQRELGRGHTSKGGWGARCVGCSSMFSLAASEPPWATLPRRARRQMLQATAQVECSKGPQRIW